MFWPVAHTINCVLDDLPEAKTAQWTLDTSVANLVLSANAGSLASKSQTSALTLSTAQLQSIKAAGSDGAVHAFTCKIAVGKVNKPVTAKQSVTIRDPGE